MSKKKISKLFNSRFHKTIIIIGLLVLLFLLTIGRSRIKNVIATYGLKNEIAKAADNEKNINLETIFQFDWDKLYFFGPYASPQIIDSTLGLSWENSDKMSIKSRDDINLLVFVKGSEVVEYLELGRYYDFLAGESKIYLVLKDDSEFKVDRQSDGGRFIISPKEPQN